MSATNRVPAGDANRAVVLVEGLSDRGALEALAARQGCDLAARGVSIVVMGGAQALPRHLDQLGASGPASAAVRVAGLYDAHEERDVRHALERAGWGSDLSRAALEALGFFVCTADLEDELIRALGTDAVLDVIAGQGEIGRLRSFQRQPAQRSRPLAAQLRRFMGTASGRKIRYAPVLVAALDLERVPRPLEDVLAYACAPGPVDRGERS